MNEQIKSDMIASALTALEAECMIVKNLPPIDHQDEKVEHVGNNSIRIRLPYNAAFMGQQSHGKMVVDRSDGDGICRYRHVLLRDGGVGGQGDPCDGQPHDHVSSTSASV